LPRIRVTRKTVSQRLDPEKEKRDMPQTALADYVEALDKAGLLTRYSDEKRPRTWKDIVEHFAGQPYPVLYRAFGRLRPRLGRIADERPRYPCTFADTDFVYRHQAGTNPSPQAG
jgi:hypothetical protein